MIKKLLIAITIVTTLQLAITLLNMQDQWQQRAEARTQAILRMELDGHDYLLLPGKCFAHSAACRQCAGEEIDGLRERLEQQAEGQANESVQ